MEKSNRKGEAENGVLIPPMACSIVSIRTRDETKYPAPYILSHILDAHLPIKETGPCDMLSLKLPPELRDRRVKGPTRILFLEQEYTDRNHEKEKDARRI